MWNKISSISFHLRVLPRPPASHSPLSQHTRTLSIPAAAVWPVRGSIQCFNVCCVFVHFYLFNNSPPPCCLSTLHPPQLIAFFCSCFDCLLVCVYLLCFYLVMISYVTHLRGEATERHHLVPRITPTLWIILHKWGSSQQDTESRTGAKLKHIQDNCSVVLTLAGLSPADAQCARHSKLYSQIQGPHPVPHPQLATSYNSFQQHSITRLMAPLARLRAGPPAQSLPRATATLKPKIKIILHPRHT